MDKSWRNVELESWDAALKEVVSAFRKKKFVNVCRFSPDKRMRIERTTATKPVRHGNHAFTLILACETYFAIALLHLMRNRKEIQI